MSFNAPRSRWFRAFPFLASGIAIGLLLRLIIQDEVPVERTNVVAPPDSLAEALAIITESDSQSIPEVAVADLKPFLDRDGVRDNEALLSFNSDEAYAAFLSRAGGLGLEVVDKIDALRSVRVRYDSLDGLQRDFAAYSDDYANVAANPLLVPPGFDDPELEARALDEQVPVGNALLQALGLDAADETWGRGVTIAVLDSGVAADATFGLGRLQFRDIGLGITPAADHGHGTAVAALAAGALADARGVAPSANILSIRVTDPSGVSDAFTVARGIVEAVDAGAQVINLSLGGYGSSALVSEAISYATDRGRIIVASAGNDQASQVSYPASDPRVIAVGSVDATGQQVSFSNSGHALNLMAPGLGVQTAWVGSTRIQMSGTSASAGIVSGGVAALLSQSPGMTAIDASAVLQQYASDAGAAGADPLYGSGVLNLGWAMNRNVPGRIDTAVSSLLFNGYNNQIQVVVQNRSSQPVNGSRLSLDIGGTPANAAVPHLTPGATHVISIPMPQTGSTSSLTIRSQLLNPAGMLDAVPANNRRTGVIPPQFNN